VNEIRLAWSVNSTKKSERGQRYSIGFGVLCLSRLDTIDNPL